MIDRVRSVLKRFIVQKGLAKPGVKIIFINHEETLTGAPAILFSIAQHFQNVFGKEQIRVLSIRKGEMHQRFVNNLNVVYHDDLYPGKTHDPMTPYRIARSYLRSLKPKLVYANCVDSHVYARAARSLRIPVILHAHELRRGFHHNVRDGHFNDDGRISDFASSADHFICPSKEVYDLMVNDYGVKPSLIEVIHEFIDADSVKKLSEDPCEQRMPTPLVAGCGAGEDRKGLDRFVEVARQMPRVNFIWIGNRHMSLPDIPKNVHITGWAQNPFPFMNQADIFILPSKEDPFPLVVLEAMALSKPVITLRDSGGSHHAVQDTGIVMEKMDIPEMVRHIQFLIDNPEARSNYGARARSRVVREFGRVNALRQIECAVRNFLR